MHPTNSKNNETTANLVRFVNTNMMQDFAFRMIFGRIVLHHQRLIMSTLYLYRLHQKPALSKIFLADVAASVRQSAEYIRKKHIDELCRHDEVRQSKFPDDQRNVTYEFTEGGLGKFERTMNLMSEIETVVDLQAANLDSSAAGCELIDEKVYYNFLSTAPR